MGKKIDQAQESQRDDKGENGGDYGVHVIPFSALC